MHPPRNLPRWLLCVSALLLAPTALGADDEPVPAPPAPETPAEPAAPATPEPPIPAAPEPTPPVEPVLPPPGARSALTASMEAVRQGDGGSLGEHDFLLALKLVNPGTERITIRAGNLLLRSEGGWLSPLAPTAETDMFARAVEISGGQEQRIELDKAYKVLGPALDVVAVLEASDGLLVAAAPLRLAGEETDRVALPPVGPLSLGVQHPLEAVPYADGRRAIVVVGQLQLLGSGTLTEVHGSLVVGGDSGTTTPLTWTGGVEDGEGPGLWPFVQRVDVAQGFSASTVSLRLKGLLDGQPVRAELDLPAGPVEPFLCDGPVLAHWQLANGPAERRLHANLLQLRSRYAWDLVVLKDGQTYEGDVSSNEAYWAFNQSIYAVADGEVVDLCDHQLDRTGASTSLAPCVHTPVNRVVLRHADGTFTAYLHIKEKSARQSGVAKGSQVKAGQVIARVGNSGSSSEPHLQFFAFRTAGAGLLRPVPVAFRNAFEDPKGLTQVVGVPVGGTQMHFLDRKALAERPGGAGGAGGSGNAGNGER